MDATNNGVRSAMENVDEVRWMLGFIDDITDEAESITLEGDALSYFKHQMYEARLKLVKVHELLKLLARERRETSEAE